MPSLLGFPLANTLGGALNLNVRTRPLGNNQWSLRWDRRTLPADSAFIVAVDGKPLTTKVEKTAMWLTGEAGASPIVQVAQVPAGYGDPAYFINKYFSAILDNKLDITWNKPADVTDVEKYRVYHDNRTGTVDFTTVIEEILEDGSASYRTFAIVPAGTYKVVVTTVDLAGNEDQTVAAVTKTLVAFPGHITNFALTYAAGPKTATLTWLDPTDISGGTVDLFDNLGAAANLIPNYDSSIGSVAAGVQSFTTGALADGIWAFGIRVTSAGNQELNTSIILVLRIESTVEIANPPPKPFLEVENLANGSVRLLGFVFPDVGEGLGFASTINFFTNDGAGGAIDYGTPLSGSNIALVPIGGSLFAPFDSVVYGETARKFAARAFSETGVVSVNSDEVTITPDATDPPQPLGLAVTTGRN